MADTPQRGKVEDFNRAECCRFKCNQIDPVKSLVVGYRQLYSSDWENCLNQKWSVGDCVTGCHNDTYGAPDRHCSLNRNSHQYCVSTQAINEAIEKLSGRPLTPHAADSFEDFYEWVSDTIKTIHGIGDLSVYDTALRMGRHFAKDGKHYPIEPQKYVYLHKGALWGAEALQRISRLGTDYINPDLRLDYRIAINEFCDDLQSLGANHLENFLCIYHNL
ncbi:MAG: hypothetical protein K2K86_06595, partial [Muribaculaceae bacterium]|nr:hypothetical protein [Muribaculaceae bacterium]